MCKGSHKRCSHYAKSRTIGTPEYEAHLARKRKNPVKRASPITAPNSDTVGGDAPKGVTSPGLSSDDGEAKAVQEDLLVHMQLIATEASATAIWKAELALRRAREAREEFELQMRRAMQQRAKAGGGSAEPGEGARLRRLVASEKSAQTRLRDLMLAHGHTPETAHAIGYWQNDK